MPRGSDPTSAIPRPSCGLTGASEARLAKGLRPLNGFPWSVPVPATISGRVLREVMTVAGLPINAVPISLSAYGTAMDTSIGRTAALRLTVIRGGMTHVRALAAPASFGLTAAIPATGVK